MAAPCICKVPMKSLPSLEGSHSSSTFLPCLGLLMYPAACWWRGIPGAQGMWMGDLWIFSLHAEAKVSGAEQFWRDQSAQIKDVPRPGRVDGGGAWMGGCWLPFASSRAAASAAQEAALALVFKINTGFCFQKQITLSWGKSISHSYLKQTGSLCFFCFGIKVSILVVSSDAQCISEI